MATPQIGVMFRREQPIGELVAYAQRAEAMGFDQLWVVEDCFYHGGITQAAIALASTSTITVGLGIAPAVARNPAMLAMEFATLANAFPNRFIGGIGHGVDVWMRQIGAKPKSWLRSIEEITTAVRALLHGEELTTAGEYVRLDQVRLDTAPICVPPILLGVRGDKSLSLASRCADGVLLAENSAPEYVRHARMLAGGEHATVVVYVNSLVDDEHPDKAIAEMRPIVAGMNLGGVGPSVAPAPFAGEFAELINASDADELADAMPVEWIQQLSIAGSFADAHAAVKRYGECGANVVILVPPESGDFNYWLEQQSWAVAGVKSRDD